MVIRALAWPRDSKLHPNRARITGEGIYEAGPFWRPPTCAEIVPKHGEEPGGAGCVCVVAGGNIVEVRIVTLTATEGVDNRIDETDGWPAAGCGLLVHERNKCGPERSRIAGARVGSCAVRFDVAIVNYVKKSCGDDRHIGKVPLGR